MDSSPGQLNGYAEPSIRAKIDVATHRRHAGSNPLLALSIGRRLALGFLIPIIVIFVALGSIGFQSHQLLTDVSTFNQHLLHSYTSLSTSVNPLQQTHTNLLGALNDTDNPQTTSETLREDRTTTERLMASYDTTLKNYLQQDVLDLSPTLSALLRQAGHEAQISQQRTLSNQAMSHWQAYQNSLIKVFGFIADGHLKEAHIWEVNQVEQTYADTMTSLLDLIEFTNGLVPAIHDASMVEENRLLLIMGLSALSLLAGIALVTWLVTQTLVRRLQRFRAVIQSVEHGQFAARVAVEGRDEIALVSKAVNTTLDSIVGLLEETQQQRDELAKGEELKHLHEKLQLEQEALQEANARLERLSTTDMLTELPNHRALQQLLEKECERARRSGHPLSLLFFDGDRFKHVNDTYGHAIGDAVLRELGARAKSVLRAGDTLGRFGGEEFLVLLPETNEQEALSVAERLRYSMAASPLAIEGVDSGIAITVSIGVASFPTDGATGSLVKEQADQAMYWAKRLGRNQVRTAAEAERANRDAELKAATAYALERQELTALSGQGHERHIRAEQLGLIYSLMGALDWREPGMAEHAHEVSDLVVGMARALQFDEERTLRAATAAFLHDIGKIAVPDRLLQQSREHFSPQEWQLLHQHAELGASIVEASPWLSDLTPAIRHHHEHWDGTGTPGKLAGEDIPLEARMIAIAEAFHDMITEKPYQTARSIRAALDELERDAGSQFDPALLPVFQSVLEHRAQTNHPSYERRMPNLLTQV